MAEDESKLTAEEWRDSTMARIDVSLVNIERRLSTIHYDISDRPRSHDVTKKRRGAVLATMALVFVIVQGVDYHTEICGPGHRSEHVVEALIEGDIQNMDDLERIANDSTPNDLCGLTFPTHTHDFESFPQRQHVLGFLMYAVLFALGYAWYRWPDRERSEIAARKEAEQIEEEESPQI